MDLPGRLERFAERPASAYRGNLMTCLSYIGLDTTQQRSLPSVTSACTRIYYQLLQFLLSFQPLFDVFMGDKGTEAKGMDKFIIPYTT